MRRAVTCFLLTSILLLGISSALMADASFVPRPLEKGEKYVPGMILVQFKQYALPKNEKVFQGQSLSLGNSSIDALNQKYNATRAEQVFANTIISEKSANLGLPDFYAIYLDPDADIMQAIWDYGKNEYVVLAETNPIYQMRDVPNDPLFTDQYWLDQVNDADIDAPEVWNYESGDSTIVIGVNDSGVLWNHPDLLRNIWQNLGEDADGDGRVIEGGVFDPGDVNNIDNDGNGLIDDFIGYDWVNVPSSYVCPGEDYGGYDNNPTDFEGHGTVIAGIIAGTTNNGIGVAGIAGGFGKKFTGARIMCLRTGYLANDCELGSVDSYAAVLGFNYAIYMGADVVNISWGPQYPGTCTPGYGYNATTRNAILNCINNGIVVTISAGNDAVDCPDYMALIPGVLIVAATDQNDNRAWFSNYGDWIHLSAAGVSMMSTWSDAGTPSYVDWDGTSFSAPAVAGVAALIRSHNPTLSVDSVRNLLMNTADPLSDPTLGAGRVNAYNAIMALPTAYFTSASDLDTFPPFNVSFTDESPTAGITAWSWDFGDGGSSDQQNPTHQYTQAGLYDVSLTITSPIGEDTYTYPKMVYAIGDTLSVESVSEATVGDTVEVHFNLKNYENVQEIKIPFFYNSGASTLEWLDYAVHTDGTRCEYFERASIIGVGANRGYIHLRVDNNGDMSPDPLAPGEGPICYLKFKVIGTGTSDITLGDSWREYVATGEYFSYQPRFIPGFVTTNAACQGRCGDANNDGSVNVSDAVHIINYVFIGGSPEPLPVKACGDANSDAAVNVSDAVFIINYVFVTGSSSPDDCASGSPAWGGSNCCAF